MSDSSESSIIKIVQELLVDEKEVGTITPALIDEKINLALMLKPQWAIDLDRNAVTDELIRRFSVWIGDDISLTDDRGHEPWLEQHPEEATTFHQAIAQLTQVVDDGILATLNLEGLDVLVDVGGGHGALLAPLLQRWPDLRGVLFEQESALAGAEVHLRNAGVFARCELVSGDFFDALPSGGAYLLKSVLHSWPDDLAERILRTCRDSAAPGAHLYIVERTVPEYGEPLFPKINDLIMLAVTGGRERTAAEYSTILQSAGFKPVDHQATTQGFSLIKGIAS